MTIPFLYEPPTLPETFAEPDEGTPFSSRLHEAYDVSAKATRGLIGLKRSIHAITPGGIAESIVGDVVRQPEEFGSLFSAAERQTRLVDNVFSQDASREEAYDRRIKAVKDATGIQLDNPERGGYSLSERELRALSADGPIDPSAHRRGVFEQRLNEARAAHPDKADALAFGNLDDEAKAIAKGAEDEYEAARRDSKLSTASSLASQLGGGMWGMRRDPLFVGSLFAGPTGAVGRSVAARIASSSLIQGLYNAGLTALEQPSVQAWRNEIGLKSGVAPAAEHVGLAFLFGAIPGAAFRAIHEIPASMRPAVQRVLDGMPEQGDIETALKAVPGAETTPTQERAIKLGDEIDAADKATRPPPAKDVPPELHEDLTAAAMRRADDPSSPSPEAVAATADPEKMPPDIAARGAEAQPQNAREAQMAADEALDDIGRRQGMETQRQQMDEGKLPAPEPLPEGVKPASASSKDPLDKIPLARDDGTPTLVSAQQAARAGEREMKFADIIRECK